MDWIERLNEAIRYIEENLTAKQNTKNWDKLPTAFNRAFQSVHGITPSSVKNEGTAIKSFPPITFKITVKGVEEMNYRIETKGVSYRWKSYPLSREIEQNFLEVPQMWDGAVEMVRSKKSFH